ncbi:MAG TPA: geranylgeranyl reductase family protein [Acidimicrobiales bacterium]|nr:geranylgeranyl reductase family protein [Acidimicrobiales bacterium]
MPVRHTADVVVVGAGPAGCAAAITLARAGRRVVLVDKATFPRDKTCGDGLTALAVRLLADLGLDPATVGSWVPLVDVMVRTPRGDEQRFALPPGPGQFAAVSRRADLDAALVELARAAGVDVREGCAVTAASPDAADGVVDVHLADGTTARAWYVVAADGMWSPLRKLTGAGGATAYLGEWQALRQYFVATGPESRSMWVWFERDLLPGYAWSFPLPDGRINIGLGVQRTHGDATGLRHRWDDLLARPHIRRVLGDGAEPEGPWRAWPIPTGILDAPLTAWGGRVLFVGDAARAGDTMTGEGIGQALETARLAARAVAGAGAGDPARAATAYRRAVRAGLYIDDLASRLVARTLARHPGAADRWLPVALSTRFTTRYFGPWMFEHHPRALPLTPWRWGRGALSTPGAWAPPGASAWASLAAAGRRQLPSSAWQTSASTAR